MTGPGPVMLSRQRSFARPAVLLSAAALGAGLLFWLAVSCRFEPVRSDGYLWGAYHVHSGLSDGLGSLAEIAAAARESGVSFVVLADHGAPNFQSNALARTISGVRFIGGSEAGMADGHLVVIGSRRTPRHRLPPFPPEAVDDIRAWGGLAVVAYPVRGKTPWRDWHPDFLPDGIEVINPSAEMSRMGWLQKFAAFHLGLWSEYELLRFVKDPRDVLARWDQLLVRGPVRGYYAVNTHGGFTIDGVGGVRYPSYRQIFNLIGLGVSGRYQHDPMAALRSGDFFSVLRGAGEPDWFEFRAAAGGRSFSPGENAPRGAALSCRVRFRGGRTRLVLYRDGRRCRDLEGGDLCLGPAGPGVYRVEVQLPDHPVLPPGTPWILSNPITVLPGGGLPGEAAAAAASGTASGVDAAPVPEDARIHPLDLGLLRPESDPRSRIAYRVEAGQGISDWSLAAPAGEAAPTSCALALRRRLDLGQAAGFYIQARSSEELRYLVELRSGDRWYYASFRLPAGAWTWTRVPLDRFYRVMRSRERPPLAGVDSLFVSVSSFTLAAPLSGRLEIAAAGFYGGPAPE